MNKAGQQLLAHLGVEESIITRAKSAIVSLDSDETTLTLRIGIDENGKEQKGFLQQFKKYKLIEEKK